MFFNKEKIFSQIKLKYFGSDEKNKKPNYPDFVCAGCGATGISVGQAGRRQGEDKPRIFCEDCAIDTFQKDHDFSSREAAASLRRREFDIFYLFVEMLADGLKVKGALPSVDKMGKDDLNKLMDSGREIFNSQFSRHARIVLAERDKQKDIEAFFRKVLKQIDVQAGPRESISVSFSREEYISLMTLVYLGNWMVNAIRTKDLVESLEGLQRKVFSHAREIGLGDFFDDPELGEKVIYSGPSREFEDSGIHDFIENYDEYTFWEELTDRMAKRDLNKTYSEESLEAMDFEEFFTRREPFEKKYNDEFCDHGLDRLEIAEKKDDVIKF